MAIAFAVCSITQSGNQARRVGRTAGQPRELGILRRAKGFGMNVALLCDASVSGAVKTAITSDRVINQVAEALASM